MSKKKCPECPAGEKWAVPYADFLSLLLALFIALYAISAVNTAKAEALKNEMIKIFDFPESKGVKESAKTSDAKSTTQGNKQTMNNDSDSVLMLKQNKNNERYNIALDQAENQVAIDLPAPIRFSPNSAEISDPDVINFINIVAMMINKVPNSVSVEIRGYADDFANYMDNYDLGAKRSFNVLKLLVSNGISTKRLRYSSFGDTVSIKNSDLKIAKIYFKVDIKDTKIQRSILDMVKEIK